MALRLFIQFSLGLTVHRYTTGKIIFQACISLTVESRGYFCYKIGRLVSTVLEDRDEQDIYILKNVKSQSSFLLLKER